MTGRENWVQKLLDNQKEKLRDKQKVPNQTNQLQTQIMIERGNPLLEPIERGNPLLKPTQGSRQVEEKRPVLRRSKHVLFMKKLLNMKERSNPLLEQEHPQTRSSDDSKSFNVKDKTAHDRTGQPVASCNTNNVPDGSQTRSSHESTSFNVGDETIHDGTGQPVVNRDESGHEQTMLNEVHIDFRIPGFSHSLVKQAQNSRVRELVKKIGQEDREPPRSTCSSTRSTTNQSLQPVQCDVKEND